MDCYPLTFTVDVTWCDHRFERGATHRTVVLADTDLEATLEAAAIVMATHPDDMVIAMDVVGVIA